MKYRGTPDYTHDSNTCIGVLLSNLGTPTAPTASALRKYLSEFLSDPRIIETPKVIWWCILHGVILRTRPRRVAKTYEAIWTEDGSPLLSIALKQKEAIQKKLAQQYPQSIQIELAMRYGEPSIQHGLEQLRQANADPILIFPLYPQYSAPTTASTFDAVADVLKTWRWLPGIRMINHYHDHPDYIAALVESIKKHWQQQQKPDKLIFSFHGLPRHYFLSGDPYHCECHKTARLVAEALKLNSHDWMVTFQSRFGPATWLQPYTDKTLKKLAKEEGVKHIQVICPGFSADCLETLEEIDKQNRDFFINAGGEKFTYIPALNDNEMHIDALIAIIRTHLQGIEGCAVDLTERRQRAMALGAKQ